MCVKLEMLPNNNRVGYFSRSESWFCLFYLTQEGFVRCGFCGCVCIVAVYVNTREGHFNLKDKGV